MTPLLRLYLIGGGLYVLVGLARASFVFRKAAAARKTARCACCGGKPIFPTPLWMLALQILAVTLVISGAWPVVLPTELGLQIFFWCKPNAPKPPWMGP